MNSTTSTVPGSQTRCRSLRDRSTSITCSERSLASASRSSAVGDVLLGRVAAGPRPGDRVGDRPAPGHLDQRLRAGADHVVRRAVRGGQAQEVHVRAGVGRAQHPVDVERVGGAVDARTAGRARPGSTSPARIASLPASTIAWNCSGVRLLVACAVVGSRTATVLGAGAARSAVIASSRATASSQASLDPLVGGVVVDGVGDQQQRPVGVVEDGEVGGQHHRQLGQVQLVRRAVRQPSPSGGRRRRSRRRPCPRSAAAARAGARCASAATVSRRASTGSPLVGTPTGGSPIQWAWPSRSVSVARLRGADDRVARPHPAVLGRLQQERAGLVLGQLAVDPDGGLGVGQEPAHDRDDAPVARQLRERRQRRPGDAVAQVGLGGGVARGLGRCSALGRCGALGRGGLR